MRRSVGEQELGFIPKRWRAARFTMWCCGSDRVADRLPHCTSRHRVDWTGQRDWPYQSERKSLRPDRRPPEPLFASAPPGFPLGL